MIGVCVCIANTFVQIWACSLNLLVSLANLFISYILFHCHFSFTFLSFSFHLNTCSNITIISATICMLYPPALWLDYELPLGPLAKGSSSLLFGKKLYTGQEKTTLNHTLWHMQYHQVNLHNLFIDIIIHYC